MHRKFIATIAALSIGITALGTAPARADDRDIARALAAILGIAVIGAAINNHNDRDNRNDVVHAPRPHRPHVNTYPKPRPLPHRVQRGDRKLLPGGCLISVKDRRGDRVRMFGKLCLEKHYTRASRLPEQCLTRVRTREGKRVGYQARCLRDRGYRINRG